MNQQQISSKSEELFTLINKQINMTDNEEELLLLAFLMMNKSKEIIEASLGESQRKFFFEEYS